MQFEASDIKDFIETEGWTDFAILTAEVLQEALREHEGRFEHWVMQGYQAGMAYLKEMQEDRFHPENKLPDIKSVIVLLAWYGQESPDKEGVVARYARGRDYHKVLRKKLLRLSEWLKERGQGIETYLSVDSGPTVDRVLAETAGLGFFGKNSNLIDPRRGSFFFIASLMVNQELSVTKKKQMPNCGNCRRCMDYCPTGAIVSPGVIDARRCISYLTIENKEGIPEELCPKIGNRLFGCDICQERCPFNEGRAGRQEVRMEALRAESGVGGSLRLDEILSIRTDEAFMERFAGTPLMRAKRRGLLRNACVVAGNSGDLALIPHLKRLLDEEPDEMLQEHAFWALKQLERSAR
jgi:epoxyqueuosine reductase